MEKITKDLVQEEALLAVLPHDRCSAAITVGGGKTKLGLLHMAKNYTEDSLFLVVAPKKSIFTSWLDEIGKFDLQYLIPHITFSTYLSLDKQHTEYDVIYLDECHSLLESHMSYLNSYEGKILGLTGTKPRSEHSEKGRMVDEYCPVVYEYTTDEAVEDDILNDYKVLVHTISLNTAKNILVKVKDKEWYTSEANIYHYWTTRINAATNPKSLQIARIQRMKAMMGFASKEALTKHILSTTTDKCIIFANTKEQAARLCYHSYYSGNASSEENLQMFKDGDITKLSCVLQLSEGINVPNLKEGIILHSYGNERKLKQRFGRLCRLSPGEIATLHVLQYGNTVDEDWVLSALADLDPSKITYL